MRGKHPNSQDNLKPFEKGVSGNPSGRAKAFNGLKDDLKILVNETDFMGEDTHREKIIERIVYMAEIGDWKAIELLERLGCLD